VNKCSRVPGSKRTGAGRNYRQAAHDHFDVPVARPAGLYIRPGVLILWEQGAALGPAASRRGAGGEGADASRRGLRRRVAPSTAREPAWMEERRSQCAKQPTYG